MSTESELSGVDLARQVLIAAREAAKKNGAARKPPRRTGTAVRHGGREPYGLGAAISMMLTERGTTAPAIGGTVLAEFDTILAKAVPELTGRAQAVAFDADTGRLDVAPDAPAAGTKLSWSAPKLIATANEKVRGANVRSLHVLAPAPVKAASTATAAPPTRQTTAPASPVGRRTPPDGYHRAIEAHRQAARPSRVDPGIAAAVERQTAAMRAQARQALPEPPEVPDDVSPPPDQARAQRRRHADVSHAAALRRAHAERAGQPAAGPVRQPG
ncbi:DUF721 domain-containing protein [Streptomyces sp. NPDC052095]|uniref:DUF721 domain-containing protein n=1 Tax=unclassified Streptomyces TaxID=2593676 RepID=UPI00344EAA63